MKNNTILTINDLSVSFDMDDGGGIEAVKNVDLSINEGEIVGLVGESGSGKTVTAQSILRLLPRPPARFVSGRILFDKKDLMTLPIEELRKIRGSAISMIFQEPMTALSPLHKVGHQLVETLQLHRQIDPGEAWRLSEDWLARTEIPNPRERMYAYPHELSGGMRQRVMIAMALMLEPRLIIADEPTTALDVTVQAQIFKLLMRMKNKNTAVLLITHDMAVVWEMCDRVYVMKDGRIVESGGLEQIFNKPEKDYTQALLKAVPRLYRVGETVSASSGQQPVASSASAATETGLIEVDQLKVWFPVKRGLFAKTTGYVKAVDDVRLNIAAGESVGLVGESGSGKTTLGRTIIGLQESHEGSIRFQGTLIHNLKRRQMFPFRRHMQMIFQDPYSSLNPRMTVMDILTEGLVEHGLLKNNKKDRVAQLLEEVGMSPDMMNRYPFEFSGGQRQRISIARALSLEPAFIVCDEAVSALDVSIQAQILQLLIDLQKKHHIAYLFISHDLSVVRQISDRIAVMYNGRIVEQGPADDIVLHPRQEYTQRLLEAVPVPGDMHRRNMMRNP